MTTQTPPETQEDPGRETRVVDVKGRTIVVRQLRDAQLALLAREADLLRRGNADGNRILQAIARTLNILESAVVQQEDRDYLMDLNVDGELELSDMLGMVSVFQDEKAKPTVRRGRPARRS